MNEDICWKCGKTKEEHITTKLPFDMGDCWTLCCPNQKDNCYEQYEEV